MPDIIQLLPDSIANQIAAGEVIQRPASAVKEMLENAVDAGADSIKLIVKDAGRTLIQVVDNGSGMSETDARLSFERHATSKLRKADDLFSIRTMGFRGEALASIAAIAQVELKTRKKENELGTLIQIEASEVKKQEISNCQLGTSIAIKNLFFNVPARRNFLKTNAVEWRHILEEFQKVALANAPIAFTLHHNDEQILSLESGNLKQRILGLFGNNYNQKLVPVEEQTNQVNITGFIGKPEFSKKTRGEQYFFVNNRFIKSPYLNHAVQKSFEELIPKENFPVYFIFMDLDPKTIDINIHPTKTEVKFEDEKTIYAILRSAIRKSIGKYNISPSLDFMQENSITFPTVTNEPVRAPEIIINPNFNPFEREKAPPRTYQPEPSAFHKSNLKNWELLYEEKEQVFEKEGKKNFTETGELEKNVAPSFDEETGAGVKNIPVQLHQQFILKQVKAGFLLIHQQYAHERILFEKFRNAADNNLPYNQQTLFPTVVELSQTDFLVLTEMEDEMKQLGFDYTASGTNSIEVNGVPCDLKPEDIRDTVESLIEAFKRNETDIALEKKEVLAKIIAKKTAIKMGKTLTIVEMNLLIDELFACELPYTSPFGRPTIATITLQDLEKMFS